VGLLGLGVVGGGVAAILLDESQEISRKVGLPVNLKKILVRDPNKPRDTNFSSDLITTNPEDVLADPSIKIVVEVIGGTEPAVQYLRDALSAGKHVVTANKEMMAKFGPELLDLARQNRVNLLFEASVGGGIPIVGSLMSQLLANDIHSIRGIINGTTNYILTQMAQEHTDFDQALREAQQQGFAEADPTNDVEGFDAVYKLSILASLAFHQRVSPDDIYRQGITNLQPQDFRYAQELGYAIKSLAVATLEQREIRGRVYPALVPVDHMLAKVDGVYNAVEVTGSLCGQVLFHGRGAGRRPTASAVLGDLIDIGRRLHFNGPLVSGPLVSGPLVSGPPISISESGYACPVRSIDDLETQYYIRLNIADQAGVLAQVAKILGDRRISIASVLQKDTFPEEQKAELVITTHPARDASVREALRLVAGLEVVNEVCNMLRIEG
jgi:homoserine dehydrogenase